MPTWPTGLPTWLSGSNNAATETPQEGSVYTDMDGGPPKSRRLYTGTTAVYAGVIYMNQDQWQTLDDFYQNDCSMGSLAFDWVAFDGVTPVSFMFSSRPSRQVVVDRRLWQVNITLTRMPM